MGVFTRESSPHPFDTAVLEQPTGATQRMTPEEFEALPLDQRIKALIGKKLKFYKGGTEINSKEALLTR